MELGSILLVSAAMIAFVAIPGLALTYAVFPKKEDLDSVERAGLSTILGLTPFFLLYFFDKNLSVPITAYTTLAAFLATSLSGAAVWMYRSKK